MTKRNKEIRKEERNYRSGHKDSSRSEEYAVAGTHSSCFLPTLRAVLLPHNKVTLRHENDMLGYPMCDVMLYYAIMLC